MARIDELQKKYPTLPRDFIVTLDVRRNGINYSETVDKVSVYDRGHTYQSRDFDLSMKDIAKERPQAIRPGFVIRTPQMYLKSGFGVRVIRSTRSPYQVMEEGPDRYALYEGDERIDDVYFPNPKYPWNEEPRTSKGTPVTSLVRLNGRCFNIFPVLYCQYFDTGDQCRFCNYNATQDAALKTSQFRSVTISPDETVEAYKIIASQMPPLIEGRFIMGALADSDKEIGIHLSFVERIARATPYLPNISISTQPMSRTMMRRLKDAGVASMNMNIEVWDPQLFEEICPGKAKNRGRERYLEAYQDAAEILGWGSVGTNMPPGVTMMPEDGHKTWQEARDSQVEGFRWLIGHGVVPVFESLVLGVGSIFGDNLANREKLPPTELLLELALAHHESCKEHDMYSRMNKLMWCPIHWLSVGYAGQLGMVEIAGDLGKWAATVVHDDANWIGHFIESHRSP